MLTDFDCSCCAIWSDSCIKFSYTKLTIRTRTKTCPSKWNTSIRSSISRTSFSMIYILISFIPHTKI